MENCSSLPLLGNEKYGNGVVKDKASKSPILQCSKSPTQNGSKWLCGGDILVEDEDVESPNLQGSERLFDGDIRNAEGSTRESSNQQGLKKLCGGIGCKLSDAKAVAADSHSRSAATCKLSSAMVLCLVFVAVEVAGGVMSNSLAILTDAAHLLSDVAGFAISLFAIWASSWEATPRQSYGFLRLEILGALLSIQLIWLLTGIIVYEAVYRCLHNTKSIDGRLMFIVASFGLFVNIIMVFVLGHHGHGHSHSHDHGHGHGHGQGHVHSHGRHHSHSSHRQGTKRITQQSTDSDRSHRHDHQLGWEQDFDHSHDEDHGHHLEKDHDHDHKHDHQHGLGHDHEHNHSHVHVHVHEGVGRQKSFTVDIDMDSDKPSLSKDTGAGDINVRGACLHVLGDLIQSVGVMIGGGIIWAKPEWKVVDVICTFFFSILVLATTVQMLRDIMEILMESTPREIDVKRLENGLCKVPGVIAVHDLHVWALTLGKTLLACHVTIFHNADADVVLEKVLSYCEQVFNISHVTVQVERQGENGNMEE